MESAKRDDPNEVPYVCFFTKRGFMGGVKRQCAIFGITYVTSPLTEMCVTGLVGSP